jgi:hypothetical protein
MDKSRGAHSLLTEVSVMAWVKDHNPGGIEKLRQALIGGEIRGERANVAMSYLRSIDALREHAEMAVRDELYLREVRAAERAVLWSRIACLIALVALVRSFWPGG